MFILFLFNLNILKKESFKTLETKLTRTLFLLVSSFYSSMQLAASLLGAESGQNAVIRTLLYQRANETVDPYNITVAEFTNLTSTLANKLGKCGLRDEGIMVPLSLGAENRTESNILAADVNSRSYSRTVRELLRILYGSGSESKVGAFFPKGANGLIARSFLIGREDPIM